GDECLTFKVKEVLLTDLLRRGQVATTHYMGNLGCNLCVVLGDVVSFTHAVYASQKQREACTSLHLNVVCLDRHRVSGCSHIEYCGLTVSNLTVDIHRDTVIASYNLHGPRFFGGETHLRRRDRHKSILQCVEFNVAFFKRVATPLCHFLRPSACRDQSDTNLYKTDVRFGGGLHAVGMEGHLATAAQRPSLRTYNNRHAGVSDPHDCALKLPHHKVKLIVVLFYGKHEHHSKVRTQGEIGLLMSDHQALIFFFGQVNGPVHALDHGTA